MVDRLTNNHGHDAYTVYQHKSSYLIKVTSTQRKQPVEMTITVRMEALQNHTAQLFLFHGIVVHLAHDLNEYFVDVFRVLR